jgi:hypothetical protein
MKKVMSDECLGMQYPLISLLLDHAVAQAVSHWLLTAAAQGNPVGFVVDKVALKQVFLQVLRFSPFSIISSLLHIYSCIG